jgi:large subunit ribosomal protein L3
MQGLLGRKLGMTRVFAEDGTQVPVTVIEAGPCVVLQRKTKATDGYDAVQVGFQDQKPQRMTKARLAICEKAGTTPKQHVREFRVDDAADLNVGDTLTARLFSNAEFVDIRGTTKGRGFQGAVKRHRMAGGRMTHGGHAKRRPGAIGCSAYPARVSKGKAMPGHMGAVQVTTQNVRVVQVDGDENLILVHGATPGANGQILEIRLARKKPSPEIEEDAVIRAGQISDAETEAPAADVPVATEEATEAEVETAPAEAQASSTEAEPVERAAEAPAAEDGKDLEKKES